MKSTEKQSDTSRTEHGGKAQSRFKSPYTRAAAIRLRTLSQRITWFLGTRYPEAIPLTFVVGYPRSGTVWATELVADCLQLPYPRLSLLPITFPAAVHGHTGVWDSFPQAFYVARDPRDAIISRYFHTITIMKQHSPRKQEQIIRTRFKSPDYLERVAENLPDHVERLMTRSLSHGMNWAQHVRTYLNRKNDRVGLLKYEELLRNGPQHLAEAIEVATGKPPDMERVHAAIDRFAIKKQIGRRPGVRKGKAGGWRDYFSREAAEILDRHCGEVMVEMGYAEDRSWVEACPPLQELVAKRDAEEA